MLNRKEKESERQGNTGVHRWQRERGRERETGGGGLRRQGHR